MEWERMHALSVKCVSIHFHTVNAIASARIDLLALNVGFAVGILRDAII